MKISKTNITDILRQSFGANPLRVPQSRIVPMTVLEVVKNKPEFLGLMKYLVEGDFNLEIPIASGVAAEVSGVVTKNIDFKIGFKILEGFIKALGADPAAIKASIKRNKKISFSFENVTTQSIDIIEMGRILNQHELICDDTNFALSSDPKLGLITKVFQSTNISISVFKDDDTSGDVDVPLIKDYIASRNVNLRVEKKAENRVTFVGNTPLTFAFSCVELLIDKETRRFKRGSWINNLKSKNLRGEELVTPAIPTMNLSGPLAEMELLEL